MAKSPDIKNLRTLQEWAYPSPPEMSSLPQWSSRMFTVIDKLKELGSIIDQITHWDVNIGNELRDRGIDLMQRASELSTADPILFPVGSPEYNTRVTDFRCDIDNFAGRVIKLLTNIVGKDETEQSLPTHYVTCLHVGGIVGKRSDDIARALKAHHYPVIKKAGKNYCDPEHAAVIRPKYKTYLKKKANLL